MKTKFWLIVAGFLVIFSTQAQNKKAANYNNKIIDIQYAIVPDVVSFFKALEGGNKDELKAKKDILINDFDKAIKKVSAMKAFEGDNILKEASLEWFKLYKASLESEYNHIIELACIPKDKRTEEDRTKLKQLAEDLIAREVIIDNKFHDAQVEFARKHNLDLKEYSIGESK